MAKNAPSLAAVGRRRPQGGGLVGGDIRRWVERGADERPTQYFLQGARDDRTVTYATLATLACALEAQLDRYRGTVRWPYSCEL